MKLKDLLLKLPVFQKYEVYDTNGTHVILTPYVDDLLEVVDVYATRTGVVCIDVDMKKEDWKVLLLLFEVCYSKCSTY